MQKGSEIQPFEILKHLKSGLFEGQISNAPVFKWPDFSYGYSPNHSKTGTFKIQTFLSKFQMVFDKMFPHLSRFQMVGLPDFRSHSQSRPFATQPLFDNSKSRLVQISDPHCMILLLFFVL